MPKNKNPEKPLQKYFLHVSRSSVQATPAQLGTPTSITAEIIREKRLKNDDTEQDIQLKRSTLSRLFQLLIGETIIVFIFAFLQATAIWHFHLEEWSFKLLITATITQITVMLLVAVNYLFPKSSSKK